MADVLKFDDETLANTLHLMKSRSGEAVLKSEGRQLLNETNVLLKNGLLNNLLSSIKEDVTKYCKKSPTPAAPTDQPVTNLATIRLKAEIVFFICYQSQLEEPEARALIELIKFLSDMLVSESVEPQQQSQQLGLGGQSLGQAADVDWGPPVYSLLVILQLAHVGALQQTTYLLPRDVDYSQAQYQNCRSIEDVVEVGNTLPQTPGSRCGMDAPHSPRSPAPAASKDWQCDGAKGFACLAFSVLRQPDVDSDKAPASDVEWFLHEACRLRAYSYIRLCMVPVLQAAYLQDKETSLFYVAVLCELLENLAKIFCMTHYKQVHAHNENDFPYVFFPPTEEFYSQNMSFYADRLSLGGSGNGGGDLGAEPAAAVDSLEDVMSVYTSVLELRPEFAHTFWPSIQSQDIQVQHQKHQQSMAQTSEHHDIVDHYYHPFVMKAVDASFHHPRLMITAIRFVAALSNSPLGRTAFAGYLFVLDSSHPQFRWDHFFTSMDTIASQLGASLSTATTTADANAYSAVRAQEQQQQLVHSHHFVLTEKDAEGLVAIMKLITAVAVHPDVATLLHDTFRPIPRLFALLSCALPITLKGAILRALSVFARGSPTVSEEIWALVEAHRLLPITHTPFGTTSGVGQQRKQGVHGRGLRVELEEAESRAGRYPITEGFLQLLGALLSHGTPDNALGLGYRRPGLSVYLDYIIEDVLLKSHERTYRPVDWPSAQAQRWRISSLCLAILGTLLQNYPINAVPLEDPSRAALQSPLLAEVIADFREDAVEYNIEGFTTPQRCSRPKTAAFSVMHLLLGRSRLFEYMAFLLAECGAQSINNSFNEHCLSEVGAAVDLLQKQHSLAHPDARARADGSFDFALPLASNMGMGGFRASAAAAAAAKMAQAQPPLDLTALGRETFLGDSVFWQERTVAGVVGLIYECSLREGRFMSLYRAAPTKLSVTRTNDQGRITVAPVTCHDLSELLSADQDRGLLALIAQVVPMHVRSCPCLPAVNVLSVRILEHVALHLPASRLLAALIPPQAQQQRVFRDPSQPQPSFLLSEHHEAAGYLIEGCAAALRAEVDVAVEQNDGSLHYDVVCLGGEAYPYFYSLSSAYTRNTSPPNLYLTMINADSTEEAAQVDAEYIRALRLGGTIREAVLHLLLRTLTPNAACLSHQLLGLAPSVASVLAAGSGVRSDSTLANKMLAEGCLAAVLHVLSPHNMPLGTTFIQQSPEQAVDCFELVYRLCSSPLTSGIVLRRLSERHVDFFRAQVTLVLYLMHLSDEELLEGADVTLFTSQQAAANGGSNSNSLLNPNFAVLQSIKTALSSCASWLLKACTLSLRHSELSRTSGAATHATLLLRLLYGSCTAMSFGEERGSRVSVLEKLLDFATDFPVHPYSSALPNPLMQQYLQAAGLEQTMAKAGTGWGDFNQFLRQDAVHAEVMTYTVVDLRLLSSLVKSRALQLPQSALLQDSGISPEDLQTGLNIAVLLNMHAKHEAARNHLCASWCQLVNLSVASSATQLLLLHISDGNLSVPRSLDEYAARPSAQSPGTARDLAQLVFEQLFVPVSQVLLARSSRLHMQRSILPELFARCLMAQVRILTSVGASTGAASPLLLPDQHARMAESIVQLLLLHRDGVLSRPGDGGVMTTAQGAPSAAVSTAYRGLLASALEQILQVPIKLSNFTQSSSAAGASEEGKSNFQDSEADQEKRMAILAEYRSLNMDAVERRVGELVDALGRDCAQQGPAVWRLCSITALSSVLSVFSDENSGAYGSHIFVQALQVLVQRGHLQAILAYVATITPYPSSASVANAADEKGQDSLFMSALTLCVHIAGSAEGAEALLACDVMQRLVAINHFVTPPPFPDEIAYFGADAMLSREEAVAQLQSRYQMTIDLIRCLFASLPASHVIAAGAAEFLRKNQALVTQLLRMRYLSLGGLAMTEGTLAVLSMLAAVPRSPLTNGANKGNSTLEGTQALSALGSVADAFLVDISSLLGVIGANPVPASLVSSYGGVAPSPSRGSWWEHIQPAEGSSYEQQWHRTPCTGPEAAGMPADWTVFDSKKLQLGLRIVSHAAVLLRLVSSPLVVRRHRDLQAVNANAVAEAFCRCAALSEQLRAPSADCDSSSQSAQDASGNRVLERAAGLIGAPLGSAAGAQASGPSVDWLRSPLAVSAPFSRYSAAEAPAVPRASSATTTVTTAGSLNVDGSSDGCAEDAGRLFVAETLLVAAENLVCVVHSLAQLQAENRGSGGNGSSNSGDAAVGLAALSAQATHRTLEAAAAFPPHSFIRQVARWVKDLTQH